MVKKTLSNSKNTTAKPTFLKPSDGELRILGVLWQNGPSTVREVFEKLKSVNLVGYTTILKMMQIMLDKGFLERDESNRQHVYTAAIACEKVQDRLVGDLVENLFGGSKTELVLSVLDGDKTTKQELDEIRQLLDSLEMKGKGAK
ncbi:MAG: BlaI/MecI/CopY family transcriptional regulator [Thermoguttaceae bacterium]